LAEIDELGISDVLSISFMVILTVFSGVLLYTVQSDALDSAVRRQLQLRAQCAYHMLANAMLENSGKSYLRVLAESLLENKTCEKVLVEISNILKKTMAENLTLEFKIRAENSDWIVLKIPENLELMGDRFSFFGCYTIISTSENSDELYVERFDVEISIIRRK